MSSVKLDEDFAVCMLKPEPGNEVGTGIETERQPLRSIDVSLINSEMCRSRDTLLSGDDDDDDMAIASRMGFIP